MTGDIADVAPASPARVAGLRISWPLRLWIGVEVVFGVLSLLTIALTPSATATNFAWPIKPEATAALLGAFYIASAPVFVLALFARRWENIRVFIIATILFSSAELIATFLHWDKFTVGSTPFSVWFVSYLLPPPLFAFFYVWHQRRAAPAPGVADEPLAPLLRAVLLLLGGALLLLGLAAFVQPAVLIAIMPWTFTPLTTRALSGWIIATGTMMVSAANENDRTRAHLVSILFILLLPAAAIEVGRYADQVDWTHPGAWGGIALLAAIFVIGLALARGDWRRTLR